MNNRLTTRYNRVLRRLSSLDSSVKGHFEELNRVAWDRDAIKKSLDDADQLKPLLSDPDPDMEQSLNEEIARLEAEVSKYDIDIFFRQPPKTTGDEELPALPDPNAFTRTPIAWRVGSLDLEYPKRWMECETADTLLSILGRMKSIETCTWSQTFGLSKHSHDWEDTSSWGRDTQDRLAELKFDDQSGWCQLHLDKRGRLFGFRMGNVFNVVWWDRDHDIYTTKDRK